MRSCLEDVRVVKLGVRLSYPQNNESGSVASRVKESKDTLHTVIFSPDLSYIPSLFLLNMSVSCFFNPLLLNSCASPTQIQKYQYWHQHSIACA